MPKRPDVQENPPPDDISQARVNTTEAEARVEAREARVRDAREKEAAREAERLREAEDRVTEAEDAKKQLEQDRALLAQHRAALEKKDPQLQEANKLVWQHAAGAAAAALIPVPVLDLTAVAAVQLKLLNDLAKNFGVPFSESQGQAIIGTLASSFGTGAVATGAVGSLIKAVPILGWAAGALALPTVAFASTYALGKTFTAHFASGGNLLNFDPVHARELHRAYFAEGQNVARQQGVQRPAKPEHAPPEK
jgi:uncharacterized protein (DUF697 family)